MALSFDADPAAYAHRFPLAVRWGDMDAYGHVNNVSFLRYLESGRVAYAHAVYDRSIKADGENIILADTQCSFKHQLHYPAEITILSRTTRVGRTSMTMEQMILLAPNDALVATSRSILVWFDFVRQRPAPVPAWLKARLQAHEAVMPEGL